MKRTACRMKNDHIGHVMEAKSYFACTLTPLYIFGELNAHKGLDGLEVCAPPREIGGH